MRKGKLNLVQGICVLLVAVLIVGALWLFTREEPEKAPLPGREPEPYLVTLRCPQRMKDPYNDLEPGDTVYFLSRAGEMGEVVGLKLLDWDLEVYDAEAGIYREVVDPDEKLVEVQVRAMGVQVDDKFRVDDVAVNVGQTIYPETDESRFSATVWSIEKMEEEAE